MRAQGLDGKWQFVTTVRVESPVNPVTKTFKPVLELVAGNNGSVAWRLDECHVPLAQTNLVANLIVPASPCVLVSGNNVVIGSELMLVGAGDVVFPTAGRFELLSGGLSAALGYRVQHPGEPEGTGPTFMFAPTSGLGQRLP